MEPTEKKLMNPGSSFFSCLFCLKNFSSFDEASRHIEICQCVYRLCSKCDKSIGELEKSISVCNKCLGLCEKHTNEHNSFCMLELRKIYEENKDSFFFVTEGFQDSDPLAIYRAQSITTFLDSIKTCPTFLIRSPPYSGKSAYAKLLTRYLEMRNNLVFFMSMVNINSNPTDEDVEKYWIEKFQQSWLNIFKDKSKKIIILDETQKIYNSELKFWLFFKDATAEISHIKLICFSSYGEKTLNSKVATPFMFAGYCGLEQLLLSNDEFDEMIKKYNDNQFFKVKILGVLLKDYLKVSTGNHIGFFKETLFFIHRHFCNQPFDDNKIYNYLFSEKYQSIIEASRAVPKIENMDLQIEHKKLLIDACYNEVDVSADMKKFAQDLNRIGYLAQIEENKYCLASPLIKMVIFPRNFGNNRKPIFDLSFKHFIMTSLERLDKEELKNKEHAITSEGDLCERVWQL